MASYHFPLLLIRDLVSNLLIRWLWFSFINIQWVFTSEIYWSPVFVWLFHLLVFNFGSPQIMSYSVPMARFLDRFNLNQPLIQSMAQSIPYYWSFMSMFTVQVCVWFNFISFHYQQRLLGPDCLGSYRMLVFLGIFLFRIWKYSTNVIWHLF